MGTEPGARAFGIVMPLIALSLTGCSPNQPASTDVADVLTQSLPGYVVGDLACESFPDRSLDAAGRTSCHGSIAPAQDLYSPMSAQELRSLLVGAGIPQEGVDYFAGRHPQMIYRRSAGRGTATALTAACSYIRGTDGWHIGCNPSYTPFAGQPRGALGAGAVVQDSPEYRAYLDGVLGDYRGLDAAYRTVKTAVERFFAPGRTVLVYNRYAGDEPVKRIALTAPLSWTGPRGFLGYQAQLRMVARFQTSRNENQTACGYGRGTPPDEILLEVSIGPSSVRQVEEGAGPFTAHVNMAERTALFNNEFSGCGNVLDWNGTFWAGGYGRTELRSQ